MQLNGFKLRDHIIIFEPGDVIRSRDNATWYIPKTKDGLRAIRAAKTEYSYFSYSRTEIEVPAPIHKAFQKQVDFENIAFITEQSQGKYYEVLSVDKEDPKLQLKKVLDTEGNIKSLVRLSLSNTFRDEMRFRVKQVNIKKETGKQIKLETELDYKSTINKTELNVVRTPDNYSRNLGFSVITEFENIDEQTDLLFKKMGEAIENRIKHLNIKKKQFEQLKLENGYEV
jgi:hypothetical protein